MTRLFEKLLDESAHDIIQADIDHVVHPTATVFHKADDAIIFKSGQGIYLTDVNGVEWLDACGGQANVALGYGREDLIEVVTDALHELSFGTLFYGLGTAPAALLAKKLAEIAPGDINRFYFTLGGSDAVETALKIVRYVNVMNGRPEKTHIIGRRLGYHGTSMGASAMTGDAPMWDGIGPMLPGFSHIDQPHVVSPEGDGLKAAQALEDEILRVGPDKVAAFLAEPMSTPAGIYVPPDDYWPRIREICDKYDVLWVADEILTGFGRTGKMFALEHWGVAPDLMTMSKMITAAYFPLAVVGMTDIVASQLDAGGRSFYHGFSAGGHPVACALALATIDVYEREDVVRKAADVGEYFRSELRSLARRHPSMGEVRGIGMINAFDIDQDRVGSDFGPELHDRIRAERMFVRSYKDGQAVGFGPPLTMTKDDIDEVVRRVDRALAALEAERHVS
jgi:adenosylmethionine-8-amino-7-oxononanoate aminotransferase